MPPSKRKVGPTGSPTPVDSIRHGDKRVNIPTADAQDFVDAKIREPVALLYPRNTSLDPQLVWKGKDSQDADDLSVVAPALFIQEKIDPRVLVENLRRTASRPEDEPEFTLFEVFDGLDGMNSIEFYKHAANWSNRMVLGDSLQVMGSLAERENLRGQVQMMYLDPPYGVKFGSNWQVTTRKTDVRDGRLEDATRDVEQIRAFRDTWQLGIHSYLAYMRDRLIVARDLLTASGSIFVQIGDANVHLVRALLDEVLGSENFLALIPFKKTSAVNSAGLDGVNDYLVWYAKDRAAAKYRQLYVDSELTASGFPYFDGPTGPTRATTGDPGPPDRRFRTDNLTSQSGGATTAFDVMLSGIEYRPSRGSFWKTNAEGMQTLELAGRLVGNGRTLAFKRYYRDFPVRALTNWWDDTVQSTFAIEKSYVVQTYTKVLRRCILMTTDPGDLILDPTCGSGTTAYVAEQWGRRWITIDTSRVALALTRQRLMGAKYPMYLLTDTPDGQAKERELAGDASATMPRTVGDVRKGFVYKRVPHVSLRSIVKNPEIVEGLSVDQLDAAIARHAESELLYDQPYEDAGTIRVAGPFTVEALSPHRALTVDVHAPNSEQAGAAEATQQSFEKMLLENLQQSGVQNGRKAERFEFSSVELLGGKYLIAEVFPREVGPIRQRVAVSVGPRYGTVGADWIKAAAREAHRGDGFDVLLVLGFAFDPRALEIVEEFRDQPASGPFGVEHETRAGALRILLVRMNADLAMGEGLLKKSKAANLFTVFGEPDVSDPLWTGEGWQIEVRGFDVYNPITGEIRSGTADDIAMWMIDTDYNEESFFVRHCYFPGRDDPYKRLKAALKADIDEDAWESLNSTTSRPFPHPSTGKVAVKVINDYGDEVLRVLDLPLPPT